MKILGSTRRTLKAFLLLLATAHGEPTAAWKIPIDWIAPHHETNGTVHKLDKPPGESAFLQPGDELWDLSGALDLRLELPVVPVEDKNSDPFSPLPDSSPASPPRPPGPKRAWNGDWLVWNARTGMVVGRGSWNDLLAAEQGLHFRDLPSQIRALLRMTTPEGEQSLSSVVSDRRIGSIKSGDLAVDFMPIVCFQCITLGLNVQWPSADDRLSWNVDTRVELTDGGEQVLVARKMAEPAHNNLSGEIWELHASARKELCDGTPVTGSRWVEEEGSEKPAPWPDVAFRRPGGPGRWTDLSRIEIPRFGDIPNLPPYLEVAAPSELHSWIRGPVIDLHDLVLAWKPQAVDHTFLAFHDPLTQRGVITGDAFIMEIADEMGSSDVDDEPGENVWLKAELPGEGSLELTGCARERSAIALLSDSGYSTVFYVQPDVTQDRLNLDYQLALPSGSSLKSSSTLLPGWPVSVLGKHGKAAATLSARWEDIEFPRR